MIKRSRKRARAALAAPAAVFIAAVFAACALGAELKTEESEPAESWITEDQRERQAQQAPETFDETPTPTDLDTAVSQAIISSNRDRRYEGNSGAFQTEAHVTLAEVESGDSVTVYAYALHLVYILENGALHDAAGSAAPVAITFSSDGDGVYNLTEYWYPGEGGYYMPSIKEKFPEALWDKVDTQLYAADCSAEALRKAQNHFGLTDFAKPEITVLKPLEISGGARPDWSEYLRVTDDTDGEIPEEDIYIFDANVDYGKPGKYAFDVIIRDKAGNENRSSFEVTVK
ncbi:MAG: hypothetical protein LBL25_04910 [Oscillospiraceae bacterium]|nr:hypothetical protein [Oscillospiraceae bacterium]